MTPTEIVAAFRYPRDWGPWIMETTHGYYPCGTWGYACVAGTREKADELLKEYVHRNDRAYNNETGELIYPREKTK